MTEVKNNQQFVFNLTNRRIRLNKSDFSNPAEAQIFEFFRQNTKDKNAIGHSELLSRLKLLDFGDSSDQVITEREISEFLKEVQSKSSIKFRDGKLKTKMLKNVTEEDLIQFFNKVISLNPTELEYNKNELASGLKDENGDPVFTNELLDNFQNKKDYIKLSDIVDKNGNIKPGYEVFDLNGDSKLDKLEELEWGYSLNIKNLSNISKKLTDISSGDGVLTGEDKRAYHKKLSDQYNTKLLNKLEESSITDSPSSSDDLVTPEVKQLFSTEKPEISIDDLVDENGYIKKDYKLFDLNGDNRIDELEQGFFSSGGKLVKTNSNIITLENFVKALSNLDLVDTRSDNVLSANDRESLYLFAQGASQMMDSLQEFPDEVRDLYARALQGVGHVEIDNAPYSAGFMRGHTIGIKAVNGNSNGKPDKFAIASTLIHELTHFICRQLSDGKSYNNIAQEVQTFYMEHKLYEKMKDLPEFRGSKLGTPAAYIYLKKNNPELTELDIAKAVFTVEHFDWYNEYYNNKDPNILQNSEYRDIGGYFSEPDNKAQIYNASIQKAFSGLSLKDENGHELITEELKNAFSAEKPILTIKDIMKDNKIKPGFEIFDFDGDGILNGNERQYLGLVTYNDIPRLVKTLKQFNTDKNNANGDIISTEVRRQFEEEVLHRNDLRRKYNFHNANVTQ